MLLLALSTEHKLGLALAVALFAGFSLVVSMLVPRWRPQFPGRGLGVFLVAIALMFVGMMTAVVFFGRESGGEAKAEGAATRAETTAKASKVAVGEVEFEIRLARTSLAAGSYDLQVTNDGKVPHNLVVKGNGVDDSTPNLNPGASAALHVDLKPGTYDLYCSIPGHKEAGMDLKLKVT